MWLIYRVSRLITKRKHRGVPCVLVLTYCDCDATCTNPHCHYDSMLLSCIDGGSPWCMFCGEYTCVILVSVGGQWGWSMWVWVVSVGQCRWSMWGQCVVNVGVSAWVFLCVYRVGLTQAVHLPDPHATDTATIPPHKHNTQHNHQPLFGGQEREGEGGVMLLMLPYCDTHLLPIKQSTC